MTRPNSYDQHTWVDDLREGDVIVWGASETPRVVREVSMHYRPGYEHRVWMVTFVILRCSQYIRPDTCYLRHEVLRQGRPLGVRVKVEDSAWHVEFLRNLKAPDAAHLTMTCCSVKGIT